MKRTILLLILPFLAIQLYAQFLPAVIISDTLDNNYNLSTGDLDGDGDIDILAAEQGFFDQWNGFISDGKLVWYENISNGDTFIEKEIANDSLHILYTAIEDWDFDGDLDIIVSAFSGLYVYANDGVGNFQEIVSDDDVNLTNYSLEVEDLDNDGDWDLIGLKKFYLNNGDDTFVEQDILANSNWNGVSTFNLKRSVADLTGDGDADCLFSISYQPNVIDPQDTTILIWFQYEAGSFVEHVLDTVPGYSGDILLTDYDNDGDNDVICVLEPFIYFYENIGGGNFLSRIIINSAEMNRKGTFILSEDITGDGTKDILMSDLLESGYSWFSQMPNGNLGEEQFVPDTENFGSGESGALIDIDNDGDLDFFYTTLPGNNDIFYWNENITVDNFPHLQSNTFFDENENGIKDPTEYYLTDININLLQEGELLWQQYGASDFVAYTPGDYTLFCQPSTGWALTTPSTATFSLIDSSYVINHDFGVKAISEEEDLSLALNSGPTRCGFNVPFWLNYKNEGFSEITGNITLTLDSLSTFQSSNPSPDIIDGNVLIWNFSDLPPTHSGQIILDLLIADAEFIGSPINFAMTGTIEAQDNSLEFTANYASVINCSYDPNDKLLLPTAPGGYALIEDTLDYVVRFQNTGTDTAFTVRIEDRLDWDLDWNTFNFVSSSHPCSYRIDSLGLLEVSYENILLPDSTTNLEASQGFFRYKISPEISEELPVVNNRANIFFDYNSAVRTNNIFTYFVEEFPFTINAISNCLPETTGNLEVTFPHDDPFGYFQYYWSTGDTTTTVENLPLGDYSLTVTDPFGKTLFTDTVSLQNAESTISLQNTLTLGQTAVGTSTVSVVESNPPYTYLWNTTPVQTSVTAQNLATGMYSVTITNALGDQCAKSTIIEADPLDFLIVNPSCHDSENGSIVSLTDFPNLLYEWSTNSNTNFIENLVEGEYNLSLSLPENSAFFDTLFTIIAPSQLLLTTNSQPSINGGTTGTAQVIVEGGSPPYEYIWNNGEETNILTNIASGNYFATVTDDAGCTESVEVLVDTEVATQETLTAEDIFVHPNPVHIEENLTIQFSRPEKYQLLIYNINGALEKSIDINEADETIVIPLKGLTPGLYQLIVKKNAKRYFGKIIVIGT